MSGFLRGSRTAIPRLGLASTLLVLIAAVPATGQRRHIVPRMLDVRLEIPAGQDDGLRARIAPSASAVEEVRRTRAEVEAARARLRRDLPLLAVTFSPVTGATAMVSNPAGALTAAAPTAKSEPIVRGFLAAHGDLYGLAAADLADLVVLGDSPGGASGLRMLRMEQQIDGLPVFQSETRFLIDAQGRLVKSVGLMVPHARAAAARAGAVEPLDLSAAIVRLLASVGDSARVQDFAADREESGWTRVTSKSDVVAGEISARQVLFPLTPALLVPAWAVVVSTLDDDWYAVVDGESGAILWRKSIREFASTHDARFRVFVQADGTTPADSPAPQSPNLVAPGSGTQFAFAGPTIVSMHDAMDATASPNGWIDDCPGGGCTANETQTLGNNVLACLDRTVGTVPTTNVCDSDAASVLDGNGRPTGNPDANGRNRDFLGTAPRDFQTNFLPPPQTTAGDAEVGQTASGAGSNGTLAVDQFRRGSVNQQFYVANWYHDQLFALGFDEAAGNFQLTNITGMGAGNDRVLLDVQDGTSVDNANFSTPPDGTSGRAQMFLFTGPTIDRDGGLDAEILIHELTHGTSNRLVGNATGLNWDTARGMGEGWSDFYALSLLNNTNADDPDGRYASGAYGTYKLAGLAYLDNYVYGIRRFPYSTDNSVNPMTWADVDDVTNNLSGGIAPTPITFNLAGGAEVHNSGEIWTLTLWEVRSRVIADPSGANGDVPTGNQTMLQLTTDALKMTPVNPSFLDGRDAFFDADCATNGCANEESIWAGFADRGLGYGAVEPYNVMGRYVRGHVAIGESFSLPYLDVVDPSTDVVIDDSGGNGNGFIDPNETVLLTVTLTNPWRGAGKAVATATGTLSTATPGVTILDASAVYGPIGPLGTAAGDSFKVVVDPSFACGGAIDFTLATVSSLGSTATSFRVRIGIPNGTDSVVTYTGDPNPDLTIVNNQPRGIVHQINITDDFEIADLDFRINAVSDSVNAVGDLSFMLRSPEGIGTDFISMISFASSCGGTSIVNMVIDDDLPLVAANDMFQAPLAASPFTGDWLPIFNSPWAALVDPLRPADPLPNLARYDGRSTLGLWSIQAADNFPASGGCTSGNATLGAWSILVTPVHFDCVDPVPALTPAALEIDGNGVLETGEAAVVQPTWYGGSGTTQVGVTGATGIFDGPPVATYLVTDPVASYGTVAPGNEASCGGDCYQVSVTAAVRPAFHWDATLQETLTTTNSHTWTLHIGESFTDVPPAGASSFYPPIETLLHQGISPDGCGGGNYCPPDAVTREQLALLLIRALDVSPSACISGSEMYDDVQFDDPFCAAIEEATTRDIFDGCGPGNFCPGLPVSREQMAMFVLRAVEAPGFTPPACLAGPFVDVLPANPFCPWIQELKARAEPFPLPLTCDGVDHYCPGGALKRDAFAREVTRVFGLKLYEP